ncbi:ChuX/HutX family heme-like substrate-binding protein [Bartonella sp. A05]|uniref:ChuX/HutX family heme-like substrate-binding protein n=1 Tax=Bartonella sp. A05 TaxID=2967261 RepID=UPI0022A93707|nr:ChuX/HutX family heme-like substrate-binding protein [Bartonella sp. A05]MCZ2203827.1 hemin-degrading factor [Bartonella sp. A05]
MSYSAEMILRLREEKKEMRNRDFAASIGISEAEFIAAYCSIGKAKRLQANVTALLENAPKVGEVMALTRNEGAVHEKTGHFENIIYDQHVPLTLGEIDLRIFPKQWKFGFEYEMTVLGKSMKSLQFFDQHGVAIFKIFSQDATNMNEWNILVEKLLNDDQSSVLDVLPSLAPIQNDAMEVDFRELRDRLQKTSNMSQLRAIFSEFKVRQHDVAKHIANEFTDELQRESVDVMLNKVLQQDIPITCIVGNKGCIQKFAGKVESVKSMGPWINILNQKFHLHLLVSEIDKVQRVRKPTHDNYISALEAFDRNGEMVIQFFSMQQKNEREREDWRSLLDNLPLYQETAVA